MITRLWHGRTRLSDADKYAELMKVQAAPAYGSVDGLKKLYFLRREDDDVAHFLLITMWDSMESVKEFAGDQPEQAKYYPEDDAFLLEKEATSALYEVYFEKLAAVYHTAGEGRPKLLLGYIVNFKLVNDRFTLKSGH